MKILGAVVVITASTMAGWIYSSLLKKRIKIIGDIIQALHWLVTEIGYATVPLMEASSKISGRIQGEARIIFSGFTEELLASKGLIADEAWQKNLAACRKKLFLHNQDWMILENFGRTLGNTDREHQLSAIRQNVERLKVQEEEAIKDQEKNEKLYRYLGIAIGALVILIFY
jgi:stage III sporulation protein AB